MTAFQVPADALIAKNTALDFTTEYRWFVLSCGNMKMGAVGVGVCIAQLGNVKAVICVCSRVGQSMTLC